MNQVVQVEEKKSPVVVSWDYENNLERIAQDCRLAKTRVEVVLVSKRRQSDIEALKSALNYSIVRECKLSDGREIVFDSRRKLEVALEILVYANREVKDPRLTGLVLGYLGGKIEQEWKKTLFEPDLDIFKILPSGQREMIKERIKKREERIKSFHSTRLKHHEVESYRGMADDVLRSKNKLIIANGKMGEGKTEFLDEIHSKAKANGDFPIFITGKRSIADAFGKKNMEDHYRWESFEGDRTGLVGVINSVVQHKFSEEWQRAKIVLIDEVEDMFDHMATGTLGEHYEDRIYALDRLAELLGRADKVVLADAMITDQTIRWFRDTVKAKETIYTTRPVRRSALDMRVVTETELLGMVEEDVRAGRKAAVFCDYREERTHEIVRGFEKMDGCNVLTMSRKTLNEEKWTLESLDEKLLESDVAIITPIINAGVSITLRDYERVYVLAGGTLAPTSLLQSVRRFRCAHQAVVAFRKNVGKRPILCKEKYVLDQLSDNADDPLGEVGRLLQTGSGRFLADYAVNRSYQFRGFRQVFLIAAEQMGFNVCHRSVTSRIRKNGAGTKRRGEKQALIDQRKAAFDASDKWFSGVLNNDDTGTPSSRTFEQGIAHRTVVALQVLGVRRLTDELHELIFFHNLDRIVFSRMRLNRGSVASPDKITERQRLASCYVKALLEFAGVNFSNLSESRITSDKAKAAVGMLNNVVELETSGHMPMLSLFHKIFPNVNIGQKYKTTVIRECVGVLGLELVESGRSNGARLYSIKDRIESSREGVEYNLSKIADEYEGLPIPKEISFCDHIRQVNNVGVADVWGYVEKKGGG